MADDKTLDVVYLDVEIRKNGIENGLKQIGIEGKKSLHITQLAADDLNKAIKEAGDQVNITRRLFQAGAKDANTFETEMRQLDSAIKHLIETQELDTKQLLKLSGAARTAQASLDVYEGKITKLGLAHNVAIANSGKFNTQILNMVPGVSTLSGQLGIMSSAGLSAGAVLGGGLAIGAGLAVSALNKAARAAAEVADELDKNSGRVGVAVEEYQRLVYWADQNGISQDQLRQGLGDLNTRVGQAVAGNKTYAKSFEQLGISLKDSNGNTKATDVILRDLVDRLSQTENAAERTALAGAAFGEEFSRIVQPALMNGVEGFDELTQKADDLGLVLDEQTISVLVNYKDRMAEVDTAFRNAGIGITVAFLPILESLSKYTLETVVPAMQTLAGWIERIGQMGSNFLASGLGRSTAEGIQRDVENFKAVNDEIATLNENLAFHQAQLEKNAGAGRFGGVLGLTDENILVSINSINTRLATLADERAEIGERLRTFQFGTGNSNSPFVTTPPPNVPSPTGGGSTGGGSSTSSSTPKTPIAAALTEEERAAKLALDKLQNTIVGYDEERRKLETLFASGVINQEQIDKEYLRLVENTIDKLASSFASGTSTTFATQLYNDLVDVLPLLREINSEIDLMIQPGVSVSGLVDIPTPSISASVAGSVAIPSPDVSSSITGLVDVASGVIYTLTDEGLRIKRSFSDVAASADVTVEPLVQLRDAVDVSILPFTNLAQEVDVVTGILKETRGQFTFDRPLSSVAAPVGVVPNVSANVAGSIAIPIPEIMIDVPEQFYQSSIDAADRFAATVVSSASEFALDIGQAIKDGDFIQGLQGALGLGQNLAGAANLGTLPFLGGTIGIGSLVGTGLGLLSGIFGLFGGDNSQKERERLASQNRSLPNITFSNYITQNNQYTGTPQDAQVRNQYTDNAAELGDALFKNVLPRLAAIEKKVA